MQNTESFSKWNGSVPLIEMALTAAEEPTLLFSFQLSDQLPKSRIKAGRYIVIEVKSLTLCIM
jgi:hypothetical protein